MFRTLTRAPDWDEGDAELNHIIRQGKATAEPPVTSESLWDNSWDDDDVEAPFAEQLRCAGPLGTSFAGGARWAPSLNTCP